jgi:hypothetical protein
MLLQYVAYGFPTDPRLHVGQFRRPFLGAARHSCPAPTFCTAPVPLIRALPLCHCLPRHRLIGCFSVIARAKRCLRALREDTVSALAQSMPIEASSSRLPEPIYAASSRPEVKMEGDQLPFDVPVRREVARRRGSL